MYCSLDKIDLAAEVDGRHVAMQTDHRSVAEIEAEPELSVLFAMARVLNARSHLMQEHQDGSVRYVVAEEPPPVLRQALGAVGATLERMGDDKGRGIEQLGDASEEAAGELADACFRALAQRAGQRVGTCDLGMALRMLEDQTFADPPERDDEPAYWRRVLELAALTGEILRAKYAGRWVQTDRALVPFGFQLTTSTTGGSTVLFPTNRAQRVIDDGADESLFKLLLAADETMQRPPDAATGRLMPSLRDRRNVELDEIVWQALVDHERVAHVPVVVCGIDGESTFGMIRKEALERPTETAWEEALANLAAEPVDAEHMCVGELDLVAVSGSFYAAEKLLDVDFMRSLHDKLGSTLLAAAAPARGLLLVAANTDDAPLLARFSALVRLRYDEAGGRAISPAVLLVSGGEVVGFVRDASFDRADTSPMRADTSPESPRPGLLRRLLGRK